VSTGSLAANGYTHCACRGCFDITISADATTPDLCGLCEQAGCEPDNGECQRANAYHGDTDNPDGADPFAGAEIIHAYSRAQAIADGVLVEVPADIAREAGFTVQVALTAAAWADCVAWTADDEQRTGACQDEQGRLWDVLYLTRCRIRRALPGVDQVRVQVSRVPRAGGGVQPRPVSLIAHCGPGDDGQPVITIMQPGED
jgi:hypothetical protein